MQAVDSVSAMMTFEIEALINLDVVPVWFSVTKRDFLHAGSN